MITKIEIYPKMLPLKSDFNIASGNVADSKKGAPHIFLKVFDDENNYGWGEARPSHRWSYETFETVVSALENYIIPELIGVDEFDLKTIHKRMNNIIANGIVTGQPIAKSSVDMALYDLISKKMNLSLRKFLTSNSFNKIHLSYIISAQNPEEGSFQAEKAIKEGFTGIKIKAGINYEKDLDIIKAISEVAKDLFIIVDANQSWDIPKTIKICKELYYTNVKYIEQPLPANDILGYSQLLKKVDLPIALDESIYTAQDLINHIKLDAINALVLKISRCAGIYNAYLIGRIALENGITLIGGGLTESSLGMMASAQLFAALNISLPVDLNGMQFLSDHLFKYKPFNKTYIELDDTPGIGIEPII
ncbi:MAG TPA: enolase C-terminal domain-like protein [Bacteroidota bacterium]|nr:enolase C-terminal domain-like protein [Bacteroidota bacterium]